MPPVRLQNPILDAIIFVLLFFLVEMAVSYRQAAFVWS
jgi:hypothetical protein